MEGKPRLCSLPRKKSYKCEVGTGRSKPGNAFELIPKSVSGTMLAVKTTNAVESLSPGTLKRIRCRFPVCGKVAQRGVRCRLRPPPQLPPKRSNEILRSCQAKQLTPQVKSTLTLVRFDFMTLSRRSFVGTITTGMAALGSLVLPKAESQFVYQHSDWKFAEFDQLIKHPARAKQVFDVRPIGDGKFLSNMKNSLNGFHFGFNVPANQIKLAAALHGPSNMLNFDDSMWEKYRLGEWLQVTDPKTGKPAIRNIYLRKGSGTSTNPNDSDSPLQDASIEALQARGVAFLSCHTATEEQAHALVAKYAIKSTPEEIVQDLQAHTIQGVLIVPSMVTAVSLLQSDGHFTYVTI